MYLVFFVYLIGEKKSEKNSDSSNQNGRNGLNKIYICLFPTDGMSRHVLRTPVNITLRRFARGSDAVSASWNFSLVGGHGGWQSDGCRILNHSANFTTISCNSLGNYGLLMVGFNIPCFVCMK